VLGELVPKSIALQRSESTVLLVARPLLLFSRIFHPFIALMNGVGNGIVRLLGMHATGEHTSVHSVAELEMLVTESREVGFLDNQEEVMLRRVFDFGDKTVLQVMMPRTEVIGLPLTSDLETLVETATQTSYTRFPVYNGDLDNIVGMLHIKDLLTRFSKSKRSNQFNIQQIIRPVLRVPETVLIENLLLEMRTKQQHMAQVVDEYGGTAGIVTLEDIMEEIIGEVHDEFDTAKNGERVEVEVLPDGSSSVDGLMSLADFEERFGINLEEEEYETIAGYVFGRLGSMPKIGQEIKVGDYSLGVTELDNLRIARIKVKRINNENGVAAQTGDLKSNSQ
jgi:putative hemolysin